MKPSSPDPHDDSIKATDGGLGPAMARLFGLLASPEMSRWRVRMVVALVLTVVAKLFAVYAPVFFGDAINAIAAHEPAAADPGAGIGWMSGGAAAGFAFAFIAYAVARFLSVGAPQLRDAMFAPVSQDAQRLTSVRAFGHVQGLSIGFHQMKRTGALNRIIDRGARAVDFLMRFLIFNIAPTLLELVLAAGVLSLRYGWEFAVIALTTVGIYMAMTWSVTDWREDPSRHEQRRQ